MATKKKINSIDDLSSLIVDINKKYNIEQFIEESMSVFEPYEKDKDKLKMAYSNPEMLAMFLDDLNISQDEITEIFDKTKEIHSKYHYSDYVQECYELRNKFIKDRKHYLYYRLSFMKMMNKNAEIISDLQVYEEIMIIKWLDNILQRNRNKSYTLSYEDIDGVVKTFVTQYRPVEITQDYVDAPLIDRHTGATAFDQFVLHAFYDIERKTWIMVPVRNIIDMDDIENEQ